MPTFIDESGDSGPGVKSARHFRLVAVWFSSMEDVEQYIAKIGDLKVQMNISQDFEFHFAKISHPQRLRFYEAVAELPFRFAFQNFDKDQFNRDFLDKERIIASTIEGMVRLLTGHYLEFARSGNKVSERVIYDECNDKKYTSSLQSAFNSISSHSEETRKFIKSVKPGKSKSDLRIQLADMICSATCRHLDGDNSYFDSFRGKAIGIETVRE